MEVVELKVRLHCKDCEKAVRKTLCKIKGVRCVEIDAMSNKITVLGYLERKVIIKAVQTTGRKAEVWSSSACHQEETTHVKNKQPIGFGCIISRWPF